MPDICSLNMLLFEIFYTKTEMLSFRVYLTDVLLIP